MHPASSWLPASILAFVLALGTPALDVGRQASSLPDEPLTFGPNSGRFNADRTFSIRGQDWPSD